MKLAPDASPCTLPRARRGRLFAVVWIFMGVVVGLFMLTCSSVFLLSAVRSFIGAEAMWSKNQKDALYALTRYTLYADEADHTAYRAALAVNYGDRLTRIELEKPVPDLSVAEAGLLQGRNHPDDVAGMVFLIHWFRSVPEIRQALGIWAAADDQFDRMTQVGDRVRAAVQSGPLAQVQIQQFLQQLQNINQVLTPLEDDFSYTLGAAARKYTQMGLLVLSVAVAAMLAVAYLFSRHLLLRFENVQDRLRTNEAQLQSVLQLTPQPILVMRQSDGQLLYANAHAREQFGLGSAPLAELSARDLYLSQTDYLALMQRLKTTDRVTDFELQMQNLDSTPFWCWCSLQRIRYAEQDCVLTVLLNVDEHKRTQEALHYRADHDPLTGLPNRAMFMDAFKRCLQGLEHRGGSGALLFLDLDKFKEINDNLGHEIGDLVLQQVANRLQGCMRAGDLVARLGGDEFVVLIDGAQDLAHTQFIADKVLSALRPSYEVGGRLLQVTTSIGVSRFPQDGLDLVQLLSAADAAMYEAKSAGRNNMRLHQQAA